MTDAQLDTASRDSAPREAALRSLDDEVAKLLLQDGWSVEQRFDDRYVLTRRNSGPLWVHVLLTVLTVGIWFPIAVLMVFFDRPQRCLVWIDVEGRVLQKLR